MPKMSRQKVLPTFRRSYSLVATSQPLHAPNFAAIIGENALTSQREGERTRERESDREIERESCI